MSDFKWLIGYFRIKGDGTLLIKTLFDFTDGAKAYRNIIDKEHFIHSYPFIPYQFDLFQSSIQGLSAHNAFEGKHKLSWW